MTRPVLLMTRPRPAAERFVARLDAGLCAKLDVLYAPLLEIVPTDAIPDLSASAGVIFTSAHGVRFAPDGAGRAAHCVGQATAEKAREKGWRVDTIAQDADALVARLERAALGPLVHLSGTHRRGDIAERLTQSGLSVSVTPLYEQRLLPLSQAAQSTLGGETPVILPLFSPRTAAQFAEQAGPLNGLWVVAMSDAVAQPLQKRPVEAIHIVATPTAAEMVKGVEILAHRIRFP